MEKFFQFLFELFRLFSTRRGLGDHLMGLSKDCSEYTQSNIYAWSGYLLIFFIFLSLFMYYKVLDNYRFTGKRWWGGIGAFFYFLLIGISYYLIYYKNVKCEELSFNVWDVLGYCLTLLIYLGILYFLLSILCKRFSKNHRNIPF